MVGQVTGVVAGVDNAAAKAATRKDEGFSSALDQALTSETGGGPTVARATGTAWQPPWMAGADQASQYLLPADTPADQLGANRPNLKQFMDATGASVQESVEAIYGVTGSNLDYRDWTKIMAADDPLMAARQSANALYNSDLSYASPSANVADQTNTVAKSGNFAYLNQAGQKGLFIVGSNGEILRNVNMDAPSILHASEHFGLDTSALNGLADQLDAAGVPYKPRELYGPGSDGGVDLRDLAAGGLGSAVDWRTDENVSKKGPSAQASLASDVALAQRLGLAQNPMVTPPDLTPTPTPTPSAGSPGTGETWTAPWMEGLDQADQYLLPANTPTDQLAAARPTLAQFMTATGAGREDSVQALYGVIGSNADYRDWTKIMGSDDPVLAARQAANAQYNSADLNYAPASANYADPADVVAKSGNFAWVNVDSHPGLYVVDSRDELLRKVTMDASSILRESENFALNLSDLNGLADQLDAAGVKYLPRQLYGPASDGGVNLRDLAAGGLGSAVDWRADPNVAQKGPGAVASLATDAARATRLGLTANPMVTTPDLTAAARSQAAQAAASFSALLRLSQEDAG